MFAGMGSPRVITAPPAYTGFPIGAIRWDAFSNNSSLSWWSISGINKFYGSGKYNFRQTSQWDNGQLWGSGVNTQRIADAELAFCKGKIDFWAYDWYPPASIVSGVQESNIMTPLDSHRASSLRSNVKECLILQGAWFAYPSLSWSNATAFGNWILTLINEGNYQMIDGKPLMIFYNDGVPLNWTLAHYNALTAIIGPVYGVAVTSETLRTNLGLSGRIYYGPNGSQVVGTGNKPTSSLMTVDSGHWTSVAGSDKIVTWTFFQDARPKASLAGNAYVNKYAQPQLVSHINSGLAVPGAKFGIIYSHSEITEGGPGMALTFQEMSRHYDALGWCRGLPKPASFEYEVSAHGAAVSGNNVVIVTGAGWSYQFADPNGIQGAHDNDEMWTSTLNDAIELHNHDALQGYDIIGSTGPGLGTATLQEDGVNVATVNFAGPTAVRQKLKTRSFSNNPPVAHSVKLICDGTGQIRPDSIMIRYKP